MAVRIRRAERDDWLAWSAFNARANNGTLFHRLDFLAYHPPDRFETHHLIADSGSEIEFLFPAGLVSREGRRILASPIGASIGGPVLKTRATLSQNIAAIVALQHYARVEAFGSIEITLSPSLYDAEPSDYLAYALYHQGFRLESRRLTHVLDLSGQEERYRTLFRSTMASNVRAMRREGSEVLEGGIELLPHFAEVFDDTYKRHNATATHSLEEMADLLTRLPEDVSLVLSMLRGEPTAGVLLMRLNPRVATSFYICRSDKHAKAHGNLVVFAALLDKLGRDGVRWLDLGPSARLGAVNAGVTFFKEGIGGLGYCRDQWTWDAEAGT